MAVEGGYIVQRAHQALREAKRKHQVPRSWRMSSEAHDTLRRDANWSQCQGISETLLGYPFEVTNEVEYLDLVTK